MAMNIQKLGELAQDSNITRATKIPTITSDGNMKYNTIEKLVIKAMIVLKFEAIASKDYLHIVGSMGNIHVSSSLGDALFYWSDGGEYLVSSNDNYSNIYDGLNQSVSNKINIYYESAGDCIYIENTTASPIRISASGFALPYSAISNE